MGWFPRGSAASGIGVAHHGGMHAIFFGLKRAWHGCLRITRRVLADLGLTAARFDLLYVLSRDSTTQRQLRLTLGVNRTTISRMLGSLEILGLVAREQSYGDRRTRIVRLTEQGCRCIRIAIRHLIESGQAQLAVDTAIAGAPYRHPGDSWNDDMACLESTEILESFLRGMRESYGDTAGLYYPWHPDD
jgi:DNA-binding MarR family transcriptional regulator